jgi:hypothetical protein
MMATPRPRLAMTASPEVVFNGLNGANGAYLVTASPDEIAEMAKGDRVSKEHLAAIQARRRAHEPSLGVVRTVRDPSDLSQTGWGVIFAQAAEQAVRDALSPLLDHRRRDAARLKEHYYREFAGASGYHAGESAADFLSNRGARVSGSADPEQMPYYLLIVGDPETIPYSVQYQLDVQYAVGRICFDTVDEYASYAASVVRAETATQRPRRVVLVGVANDGDRATQLAQQYLVVPLSKDVVDWQRDVAPDQAWEVQTAFGPQARKDQLARLLGGDQTPALLFTASHGVGFPSDHPLQLRHQGALVCQDWPGPQQWSGQPIDQFYFSADDVADDARLEGLVAFHFACFGLGTPRFDDLPQLVDNQVRPTGPLGTSTSLPIAPRSFVARLPQRLLGHPRGGALAVIGHVERALGSSFFENDGRTQRNSPPVFRGALNQLMHGDRLGAAIEPFNERYADVCAQLESDLRQVLSFGYQADPVDLARLWMGAADARGYAIFGDPAVRLAAQVGAPVDTHDPAYEVTVPASAVNPDVHAPPVPPAEPARAPGPVSEQLQLPASVRLEMDQASGRMILTITPDATSAGAPGDNGPVTYGWPFSGEGAAALGSLRENIASALSTAANRVGSMLTDLVADVSTLEVTTYVSDDLDAVTYNSSKRAFDGPARRRLMTSVRLDGDTVLLMPSDANEQDEHLWQKHTDLLERAQAHRAELIKTLSEAVTSLMGPLTPH